MRTLRRQLFRWEGGGWSVLTPGGWTPCSRGLARFAERRGLPISAQQAAQRRIRSLVSDEVYDGATRRRGARSRWAASRIALVLAPIPAAGAPRLIGRQVEIRASQRAFRRRLRHADDAERVENEAALGWEDARARLGGIESRAGVLLGASGLTGSLLLSNSGLVLGDDASLSGTAATIATIALLLASACSLIAGVYAVSAIVFTFARVAPDSTDRVVERRYGTDARLQRAAALMVSRHRTTLIANWKLERLKRSAISLMIAVGMVAVVSASAAIAAL